MKGQMGGNTEFYQKASASKLTLQDVFSEVFHKNSKSEGEKLFSAGTAATTPSEADMLRKWKKPWLFARVFIVGLVLIFLLYVLVLQGYGIYALAPFAFFSGILMPLTVLLFFWEMNIPRNIPLYEVLIMLLLGGVLSMIFTGIFNRFTGTIPSYLAPLTEEPAKLLAVWVFLRKSDRRYILNGILVGGAIGAGFAAIETMGYFFDDFLSLMGLFNNNLTASSLVAAPILLSRGLLSPGGHVVWAAIYSGALAAIMPKRKLSASYITKQQFLLYFICVFLLHFIWNTPFDILPLPGVLDVKFILLILAAWILLMFVINKGVQETLYIAARAGAPGANAFASPPGNAAPARIPTQVQLNGLSGSYAGQSIQLREGVPVVFGRDPSSCNLLFSGNVKGISRRHCSLTLRDGYILLQDLGSTYGTFLDNGMRVQRNGSVVLQHGQQFYLGNRSQRFAIQYP